MKSNPCNQVGGKVQKLEKAKTLPIVFSPSGYKYKGAKALPNANNTIISCCTSALTCSNAAAPSSRASALRPLMTREEVKLEVRVYKKDKYPRKTRLTPPLPFSTTNSICPRGKSNALICQPFRSHLFCSHRATDSSKAICKGMLMNSSVSAGWCLALCEDMQLHLLTTHRAGGEILHRTITMFGKN